VLPSTVALVVLFPHLVKTRTSPLFSFLPPSTYTNTHPFNRCDIFRSPFEDGDVRTSYGQPIASDTPFTPELYWNGMYQPICFDDDDMESVQNVANAVCLAAGFNGGARIFKRAGKTYATDAIPVILCLTLSTFPPSLL
jgi:hypothetical protein